MVAAAKARFGGDITGKQLGGIALDEVLSDGGSPVPRRRQF
jgi:hypothetical protein